VSDVLREAAQALLDAIKRRLDEIESGDYPDDCSEHGEGVHDGLTAVYVSPAASALRAALASADTDEAPHGVGIDPARLAHLAALTDGWDSYEGKAPTEAALKVVRGLNAVPRSDGGIQLVWHANGWEIEVDFEPDGQPSFWAHHRESGQQLTDGSVANDDTGEHPALAEPECNRPAHAAGHHTAECYGASADTTQTLWEGPAEHVIDWCSETPVPGRAGLDIAFDGEPGAIYRVVEVRNA
jgi:hypothetical protein